MRGFVSLPIEPFLIPSEKRDPVDLGVLALRSGARLRGRVVSRTGEPILRAQLRPLIDGAEAGSSTESIRDGEFTMRYVEPGPVRIEVLVPGYREHLEPAIEVAEGQQIDDIEIRLDEGAGIFGRVQAPDGAPLENIMITALDEAGRTFAFEGFTDIDGGFRIEGLEPDQRYTIEAFRAKVGRAVIAGIAAGTKDVVIELGSPGRVEGEVVVRGGGAPLHEILVVLEPTGGRARKGYGHHFVGRDGRFSIDDVEPGPYRVRAQAEGYGNATAEIELPGGGVERVRLELEAVGTVVGRVVDETGRPIPAARVTLDSAPATFRLRQSDLETVSRVASVDFPWPDAVSDPEGHFRMTGVPSGTSTLVLSHPGRIETVRHVVTVRPGETARIGVLELPPR